MTEQKDSLLAYHLDVKHKKYVMTWRVINLTEVDCCQNYSERKHLIDTLESDVQRCNLFQVASFWSHTYDIEQFIVYSFEPWP